MSTPSRVQSYLTVLPAVAFAIAVAVGSHSSPTPVHADDCVDCTLAACYAKQLGSDRIHLTGTLYAFQADGRSYLAGDTVRIYAGDSLPRDVNSGTDEVNGELLVEQKLDQNGGIDVCFDWRPTIYLEVLGTDQTQCDSMMIQTYFPGTTTTFFAYSPVIDASPIVLEGQCSVDVDLTIPNPYVNQWDMGMTDGRALAFYETSLLVNDYRQFLAANTTLNLPSDVQTAIYFGDTCPDQPTSCYREPGNVYSEPAGIYLDAANLGDGYALDHEFSHRVHNAIGGFTSDPNKAHVIQEGMAEFIRLNKEYWMDNSGPTSPQSTNRLYVNGDTISGYEAHQNLAFPPTSADHLDYAAWFWDLSDSNSDDQLGCDINGVRWSENSTLNFSTMLNTFDQIYLYKPERTWAQSFIQRTSPSQSELDKMEKVSREHRMYSPCNVAGDTFP